MFATLESLAAIWSSTESNAKDNDDDMILTTSLSLLCTQTPTERRGSGVLANPLGFLGRIFHSALLEHFNNQSICIH